MRVVTASALLTVAFCCLPARAQDGPPPGTEPPPPGERPPRQRGSAFQRLSPERAGAAWKLQAGGVARGLDLSQETTAQLAEAYVQAHQHYREAADAARRALMEGDSEGGRPSRAGRRELRQAQEELLEAEKARLRSALLGFLDENQTEQAMVPLGTFDRNWDRMVDAVAGFELGEEKTFEALAPIQKYVVTVAAGRRNQDRQAMMDAREDLLEAFSSILTEEQLSTFRRLMNPRGGRRGFGGGGFAERLMELDANGDGKIQESEVPERMQRFFDRLDANGDGELDEDEIRAIGERRGRRGRGGEGQDIP